MKMKQYLKSGMLILLAGFTFPAYSQTGAIRINQQGYYPAASKIALVINSGATDFEIVNTADSTVELTGDLSSQEYWEDAGDSIKQCDFSDLTKPGTYIIRIPGFGESYPFDISHTVLRKAAYASLKSYYYQRCSYELTEPFAGLWARAAGHPDTACILHSSTGKTGTMSSPGGWYDAGDYGKYVVNAGISVASMLSFYENFPNFFEDSTILIPESGNGENDLLDEVKYELDWLKTMQDEDGSVFVKLTTKYFIGFVMPEAAKTDRYVIGKSTAAALDFAAMMAMAGRIYTDYDSAYAANCITRAENAWIWAKANPAVYFKNPSDISTGEYGDGNASDEFIWAAAELYITTGKAAYKNYLESHQNSLSYWGPPAWPNVQPLASLSLATRPNGLSASLLTTIRNSIVSTSNKWINQIGSSPARIPDFGYYWGSNSGIANIGVGLLYANILTGDPKYIYGASECADYLLGKNATGFSFESSYGYKIPQNFHHRPSGSDGILQPVPGFVAGGPNKNQEDGSRYPFSVPAKSYVDVEGSYASNEVCINWNSPLTVLLAGVDAVLGDRSEVDFEVPTTVNNRPVIRINTPTYGSKVGSDQPVMVKGTATDTDGISKVELYVDTYFHQASSTGEFEWALEGLALGSHSVTVLAYDSHGITTEATNRFTHIPVSSVPGKVEAESFSNMSGIETEPTTDTDGGLNVTSIDDGDWMDYTLHVMESGYYRIDYRVASSSGGGQFELRRPSLIAITSGSVEATGGPQSWVTIPDTVFLSEGEKRLRLHALKGGWNINWINFVKIDATTIHRPGASDSGYSLSVRPNPVNDIFSIKYRVAELIPIEFILYDIHGRLIDKQSIETIQSHEGEFEWRIDHHPVSGTYYLSMQQNGSQVAIFKFLKSQ